MFHHDLVPEAFVFFHGAIGKITVPFQHLHEFPVQLCFPEDMFDEERIIYREQFTVQYTFQNGFLEADQAAQQLQRGAIESAHFALKLAQVPAAVPGLQAQGAGGDFLLDRDSG